MPLNCVQNFDLPGPEIDYLGNYSHGGLIRVLIHELTDGISDPVLLKKINLDFLASSISYH